MNNSQVQRKQNVWSNVKKCLVLLVVMLLMSHGQIANAIPMMLGDGNTQLTFDPQSSAGLSQWQVDGKDYMKQSWLWFRVGNSAEQSIDTLTLVTANTTDTNGFLDSRDDVMTMVLDDNQGRFRMYVKYMVSGGLDGSGRSDMTYDVRVDNTSGGAIDFSLFLMHDLDLSVNHGDSIAITGGNTSMQMDANGKGSVQHAVLFPSGYTTMDATMLLSELNDAFPTNLSSQATSGVGDVASAWQWDETLFAGESMLMGGTAHMELSQDIPVPGSLAIFGVAAIAFLRRQKRAV